MRLFLVFFMLVKVKMEAIEGVELCMWTSHMICFNNLPNVSYFRKCPKRFVFALYDFHVIQRVYGKVNTIICVKTGIHQDCKTSGPLNALGQPFTFKCHEDAAITSIKYDYNAKWNDGIFTIECCRVLGKRLIGCGQWNESTGFLQFKQAAGIGMIEDLPNPGISGLSTKPIYKMFWGSLVRTREYIIEMCYFK